MLDYTEEDVGNIVSLEHVNLQVPDQAMATLFYIVGLGLTRDPYLNVGLGNMWANIGEQQFHLPTRSAQRISGNIDLVLPDLKALRERLSSVEPALKATQFSWSSNQDHLAVTCPWGNRFRCFESGPATGDMAQGLAAVDFTVRGGTAETIAAFYQNVLGAPATVETDSGSLVAHIHIGRNQSLRFRESKEPVAPYDGHHIAIYVANFSRPYNFLKTHQLISEDVRNHQFRFQSIIEVDSGRTVFLLEHEVRSLHHPMFNRHFVNRDPAQSQRNYRRGRDALIPFARD
jgi:catechol-2,3-dioxygenase